MIWDTFDSVFWLSMTAAILGFGGVILRSCIQSKCSELNICFGLFKCIRDIKAEVEIEEHRIDMHVPETPIAEPRSRPI